MKLVIALTALAVLSVAYVSHVSAASSGQLAFCEVDKVKYGKGTSYMPWVQPVANATFYTIRTGDLRDTTTDPVSYTPGKLTPIHIRTLDLNRIFIGMVMYAINSTGHKVGTWTIPTGAPFQSPPVCDALHGVGSVVTHSDADLKPLHVVFWWQAPAGTGPVTFRVIIKQGEQNKGWFWFPAAKLTLSEGSVPASNAYVLASIGQTCRAACATQTTLNYCDATATALLRGENAMRAPIVAAGAACLLPTLSGCSAMAPFRTSDFHCFYKTSSESCATAGRALGVVEQNVCSYADMTGARFCGCTNSNTSDTITGTIPTTDDVNPDDSYSSTGSGELSAAQRVTATASVGVVSIVVAVIAAMSSGSSLSLSSSSSSRRSSVGLAMLAIIAVIALVAMVPSADAHNWVGNPSRATLASVTKPCQRRISEQPHVQVVANQVFQTEWSVGHGDSGTKNNYFVVVHADAFDDLLTSTAAIFEDYLKLAPNSSLLYSRNWKKDGTRWRKNHITSMTDPAWVPGYFNPAPLLANDTRYIARDLNMNLRGKIRYGSNNFKEFYFYDNYTLSDVRAEYVSDKYPWIESVSRFRNDFAEHEPFAHQYNLANFRVPARKGPGEYILHFMWGGYRDCVDINVVAGTTAVTNRYGIYNATATVNWIKMEHCEFYFIRNPSVACTLVPAAALDAKPVLDACMKTGSCTAVQCSRLNNPTTSLEWTPGIPYPVHNSSAYDLGRIYHPCGYPSIDTRTKAGCVDFTNRNCNQTALRLKSTDVDDQVCYGFTPFRDQDFQAVEDFMISDDPLDPRWYSTCWLKVPNAGFLNIASLPYPYPPWKAGDQCVTCDFRKSVQSAPNSKVANWANSLTSTCINCAEPDL